MDITSPAPAQASCPERDPPDDHIDLPPGFDPRRQLIIAPLFLDVRRARFSKRQPQVVRAITRSNTRKANGHHVNRR